MINVLIVAGVFPSRPTVLREALKQLHDRGVRVSLACYFDAGRLEALGEHVEVRSMPNPSSSGGAIRRAVAQRAEKARQVWLHVQRDPWVRERARTADLLVALDQFAVHAVWQLAHRHRRPLAVYGLGPAARALDRLSATARPRRSLGLATAASWPRLFISTVRGWSRDFGRLAAAAATGEAAMRTSAGRRFWRAAVVSPLLPGRLRPRLATRVHRSMLRAHRPDDAARVAAVLARQTLDPATQADMLTLEATATLAAGRVPVGLRRAIEAQLAVADRDFERGRRTAAAAALSKAYVLAANRTLHFDRLSSPLAEDIDGFLAPFRRSVSAQHLATPRGRRAPSQPPSGDRPHRLLFATLINSTFLKEIQERYAQTPGVEVRFVDLHEDTSRRELISAAGKITEHIFAGQTSYGAEVEEWLRPHLDWADTIFIDWCNSAAALFTLIDPGTTRIIVRLHSFEIFTVWPHLVDFSRVDDVIFVSDHLRDMATAVLPQLAGPTAPRLWVINNAMELRRYRLPKPAEARFNLGLVGIGSVAKDARWAIAVLRRLLSVDNRYRLILVGDEIDPGKSAAAKEYSDQLLADLAELEPIGAVVRHGRTDDVPEVLRSVGVILSSSVRESFHCALVEGAASGAVPVVRDWPFFARMPHGARTLFPLDWVVSNEDEAAMRVLSTTATEEAWRRAGEAASEHAISTWDWSVTAKQMDEVILAPPSAGEPQR